jgi:hypothetical protein
MAVAIGAAGMIRYLRVEPRIEEVHLEINTPPTTTPASIALSPDGRSVVFAALQR